LAPQVEGLCGGSRLEDIFSLLQDKLHKLDLYDMLGWYLELKKYGNLPTAGFEWDLKRSYN
jgi:asparaginyl-tRNA synthetase